MEKGGYKRKDQYVFMIYNWDIPYEEMQKKRDFCFDQGVQVSDCRYRPLDQTFDNYLTRIKDQTSEDYYIHPDWTDDEVKNFRRSVRKHNICIRQNIPWDGYVRKYERIYSRQRRLKES